MRTRCWLPGSSLPYYDARIAMDGTAEGIRFTSSRRHPGSRPVHFAATYRGTGDRCFAEEGPLEPFLTARFRHFAEAQGGTVCYAAISRDLWPLYEAAVNVERNTRSGRTGSVRRRRTPCTSTARA